MIYDSTSVASANLNQTDKIYRNKYILYLLQSSIDTAQAG